MTPGSAKRRARIFVGVMCSLQVFIFVLSMFTDNAIYGLGNLVLVIIIIVVYLVGSCKLQVSLIGLRLLADLYVYPFTANVQ